MAITRAQQAKQMLQKGGRIGLKGGADASMKDFDRSANPDRPGGPIGRDGPGPNVSAGGANFRDTKPDRPPGSGGLIYTPPPTKEVRDRQKKLYEDQFYDKGQLPPVGSRPVDLKTKYQRFLDQRKLNAIRRNKVLALRKLGIMSPQALTIPGQLFQSFEDFPSYLEGFTQDDLIKAATSGPYLSQQKTKADVAKFKQGKDLLNRTFEAEDLLRDGKLTQKKFEEIFPGPPKAPDRDGPEPIIPIVPKKTEDPEEEEDITPVRNLGGLSARIGGSLFDFDTFAADGGRIGLQEGGGIEQRLEQLGGDVTSAEQVLQAINKRLETAESSLGSGGAMQQPAFQQPVSPLENAMRLGQLPLGQPGLASIANYKPFEGKTFGQDQIPEQYKAGFDEFKKGKMMMGGQAMTFVGLPDGNRVMFGNTGSAGVFGDYLKSIGAMPDNSFGPRQMAPNMTGMQSQRTSGVPALGFAEGGIADMDREAFILGGIAKGLKKAVKGVKKLAKSPIGKAAIGAALFKFGGGSGIVDLIKANPKTSIFLASLAAGAMTPKQDEGKINLDEYYATGQTGDVEPFARIAGSNFDFYGGQVAAADGGLMRLGYQEGGDAEPVAKKTMPLIDMDGMEKDYRETGGFVEMGRMERADDVPARLSKNEFVFTADAVRNAGEGDIDKGAEVMYNMMKNLEAGGEVSEESQGLEGARKMFQTSQRLEEVL